MDDTGAPDIAPDPRAAQQLTLERLVFPARHAGMVAVAAALPFITSIGTNRWWLVALMLGFALPCDIAFARYTRKHQRFPPVMSLVNQLIATVVVLLAPEAFAACALLLLSDNALTSLAFGRRYALFTSVLGAAALAGASAVSRPEAGSGIVVAFLIASVATAWIIGVLGEQARASDRRFGALVGDVDVVLWEMVPGTNRFSYVSPAAEDLLGYPTDDWYAPGFWVDHIHPADADRAIAECDAAVAAGIDHTLEYRMVRADGAPVHLRDVATVHLGAGGGVEVMRGVMVDVTDRRTIEELLRERATHDPLTGLPNRALFADRIEQALREGKRTDNPVALLLLDLDDFKEVNDALGHEAGDRLLVAFADRLRHELRDCDTIARLGGDEFALLLTTDADAAGATAVAQRVLEVAERPFDVDGLHLQTRASIGIAIHPDHAGDAATLSARADVAMYLAKRSGRGAELYEPELDRSSVRRLSLLGHLRGAIAAGQLDLEFQPCFDLATGRLAAVEALVRWDHPEHGRIGPDDFIRLAEMSGLIEPLSRWVVNEAVQVVAKHAPGLQVSANLSVRNLVEPDLVAWFEELVAIHDLQPGQLVLELTESEVVEDIDAASAVLRTVADLGIGIAIDDFGAGQSALAYLRQLPVDELKLDRALVTGVGEDDDVVAICSAVVELAHRLGLRVVAEGVAGPRDIAALQQMGCDRGQGYFLGEPVPADQLVGLVARSADGPAADSWGPISRQ
jgi:diguanylate cyclase (GGDEF)-like protein/PAS domain S-box-containing protein